MIARGCLSRIGDGYAIADLPPLALGTRVSVHSAERNVRGRILSVSGMLSKIALDSTQGLRVGAIVEEDLALAGCLGMSLLGRCIDPLDFDIARDDVVQLCERRAVERPMWTGVRAIDALLTIGRGARVGVFGAPGAGKSTLLEAIVRGTRADAVVLGLVGERGREAERWVDACSKRTTIVCATSDRAPRERVAAAQVAFAQARALARLGLHVLLVLDSLARVAYALREMKGASGEPIGRGGYPASVFSDIACMVEGAGSFACGSVTLVATVLNDGDDRDPVSEAARSLLDGHIQLSPRLASAGHYPAIDILTSASRTMNDVADREHQANATSVRGALAALEASADIRSLGVELTDPEVRAAVCTESALAQLLRQGPEPASPGATLEALAQTADTLQRNHEHFV
jgi:FliI/YscN family ATPase